MPAALKQLILSEIAHIVLGVTFRGRDATHHSSEGTHQLVRIGDISESGVIEQQKINLIKIDDRTLSKFELRSGDVILASRGDRMPVAVYELPIKAIAGSQFFIIRLRAAHILPAYLRWFLSTEATQAKLSAMSSGTYIKSLSKENLESIEVPIPSVAQQRIIIELSKLSYLESELMLQLSKKKPLLTNRLVLNNLTK